MNFNVRTGFRNRNGTLQGHCLSPRFSCRESRIPILEGANVPNPNPSCSSAERSPKNETGVADGDLLSCSPGYNCFSILFDPLHSSYPHQTFFRAQYPLALLQHNKQNYVHNAQPLIFHKRCHCSASKSERRLQSTTKAASPAIQ